MQQYIEELDIKIEFNETKLEIIAEHIKCVKNDIYNYNKNNELTTSLLDEWSNNLIMLLYEVADLSLSAFSVNDSLYDYYAKRKNIEMYKIKYNNIHKPYNLLKNRINNILDTIDEYYEKI